MTSNRSIGATVLGRAGKPREWETRGVVMAICTITVLGLLVLIGVFFGASTGLAALALVASAGGLTVPARAGPGSDMKIRPTALLVVYALASVAMFVVGLRFGIQLAAVASCVVAGCCVSASRMAAMNLKFLDLEGAKAEWAAYAGESITVTMRLTNRGAVPIHGVSVRLERGQHGPEAALTELNPAALSEIALVVEPQGRGVFAVPTVILESTFPFGFFRARRVIDIKQPMVIAPAPEHSAPLATVVTSPSQPESLGDDEFSGIRPYVPGDPISRLSWRHMARGGDSILVKTFTSRPESDPGVVFGLGDVSDLPDDEAKLARLCAWVLRAEESGMGYGLNLPGAQIAVGLGRVQMQACMGALARHTGEQGAR